MTGVILSKRFPVSLAILKLVWSCSILTYSDTFHLLAFLYIYISVIFCHILSLSRYKWQWFKSSGDGALRANPDGAGEHDVTMRTANQRLVKEKSKTSRRTVWHLTLAQAGWLIWTQRISQLDIATGQGNWFGTPSKTAEHGYVINSIYV